MGKILPAAFVMLILLLGCTIQDAELPPEPHVPEIGCAFDNPPCDAGYDCVDNECALKPGCMYGNPPCDDNHTCSNNTCELREGCAYGNPPCEYGYACILGKCEGQVFDDDGRLTPYARSFRPEQFSLNLSALPELHPESYGNNYFEPGNYTVRVGDGFGKGDFLVKFVEFIPQNDSVNGRIIYEVFRKERDGNYYHYPTIDNTISRYSYTDMFGITIESPVYSWEIGSDENTLIYHPNCTVFMDYCEDEASGGHYAPNDYLSCAQRCDFDALPAETKEEKVIFSAIYPSGYGDLALFSVDLMKQCYRRNVDFLGFDPKKPRVGMKVYLAEGKSDIIGADEAITAKASADYLDLVEDNMDYYMGQVSASGCSSYMRISHELTHIMMNPVLGIENRGLIEGLAEFVEFHNNASLKEYVCLEDGWHYGFESGTKEYASLSSSYDDGLYPIQSYYATGFCFWQDYLRQYGYPGLVLLIHELNQRSRGTDGYYVLDVMEDVNGPLPQWMLERYSLTRESAYVPECRNCELFLGNVNESGVWIPEE